MKIEFSERLLAFYNAQFPQGKKLESIEDAVEADPAGVLLFLIYMLDEKGE